MRIHLVGLMLFAMVVGLCPSWAAGAPDASAKPKLGVMKFETAKGVDEGLGTFLYDAMSDKLIASGRYTVVDWRKIERTIKALQKAKPGLANDDAMEQAIGQLGLQQVCVGSLTKVGKKYFVTVKILNADMSAARSAREAADSEDALVSSMDKIAAKLIGQAPVAIPPVKPSPKPVPSTRTKPKIGIMKFDVAKDLKPALGAFLYGELMHEMVKSKQFVVVDWEEIDRVLRFVAKSQPNISAEAARKQAIHQLGLEKMYIGSVAKVGKKYYVTVKVMNLDLSVATVQRASTDSEDGLERLAAEVAPKLIVAGLTNKGRDEHLWLQAVRKDTYEAYTEFLRICPRSSHAAEARLALATKDAAGWNAVAKQASEQAYEKFLKAYPRSRYVAEANKALKRLLSAKYRTWTLSKGVTLKLARIPTGKFVMGSPRGEKGRDDDEGPQRQVTIGEPFYMGITEVTQAQWKAVMNTQPWKGKRNTRAGAGHPATCVGWDDATAFCTALSKKTGRAVRLPTEAEWEYACRAGTTTVYSFGDDPSKLDKYAWCNGNAWGPGAHAVGVKEPNAWGLYDMHGNVLEWCADWYADSYANADDRDPKGPANGRSRILRGGAYGWGPQLCRAAARSRIAPEFYYMVGFRVVVMAERGSGVN